MSMNLTCHVGRERIELWQTPTFITWMCLSTNPKTLKPDGGNEGVRRRYILWVESSLDGVWTSAEDLRWERENVALHTKRIKELKRPSFSYE